jgi:hypothetical protein
MGEGETEEGETEEDVGSKAQGAGKIVLGVFGLLALLTCCGGGGYLGMSIYESESAGIVASYALAFPVGFSFAGLLGAVVGYFGLTSKGLQIALPIVLGFVAGIGCLLATFVFFVTIFPAL